jgi:hypothetical protein
MYIEKYILPGINSFIKILTKNMLHIFLRFFSNYIFNVDIRIGRIALFFAHEVFQDELKHPRYNHGLNLTILFYNQMSLLRIFKLPFDLQWHFFKFFVTLVSEVVDMCHQHNISFVYCKSLVHWSNDYVIIRKKSNRRL